MNYLLSSMNLSYSPYAFSKERLFFRSTKCEAFLGFLDTFREAFVLLGLAPFFMESSCCLK